MGGREERKEGEGKGNNSGSQNSYLSLFRRTRGNVAWRRDAFGVRETQVWTFPPCLGNNQ